MDAVASGLCSFVSLDNSEAFTNVLEQTEKSSVLRSQLECLQDNICCLGIGKDQQVPAVSAGRRVSAELQKSLSLVHELAEMLDVSSAASSAFQTVV